MGRKILVDTNIAIGYIGNMLNIQLMDKLDKLFNSQYHISVINKIEMLGYPNLDKNEEAKFKLLIDNSFVHDINNLVIDKTIQIRKKYKIKLPDALIAATCLVNELAIITLNSKDFVDIEGINVISLESLQK